MTLKSYALILGSLVCSRELDLMILMGSFQCERFYDCIHIMWDVDETTNKKISTDI